MIVAQNFGDDRNDAIDLGASQARKRQNCTELLIRKAVSWLRYRM
ncbi:MAG: hypothetical protein ACLRMZ_07745 [Blautia marasmi]